MASSHASQAPMTHRVADLDLDLEFTGAASAPPGPGVDPIINGACAVCNATQPCLFNVISDPGETRSDSTDLDLDLDLERTGETKNIAAAHPDVVKDLLQGLRYEPYVTGHMSEARH